MFCLCVFAGSSGCAEKFRGYEPEAKTLPVAYRLLIGCLKTRARQRVLRKRASTETEETRPKELQGFKDRRFGRFGTLSHAQALLQSAFCALFVLLLSCFVFISWFRQSFDSSSTMPHALLISNAFASRVFTVSLVRTPFFLSCGYPHSLL